MQRKRRHKKGGSSSTLSLLRRELREGTLQSLFGGSSYVGSSNSEPDPLLSSFMYNPAAADESVSPPPCPSVETTVVKESPKEDFLERFGTLFNYDFAFLEKRKRNLFLQLHNFFAC